MTSRKIIAFILLSLFAGISFSLSGQDNQEIEKDTTPPEDVTTGIQLGSTTRGLPPLRKLDIQALIDKAGDTDTVKVPFGKYILEKGLIIRGRKNFVFECERGSQIFVKDVEEDIITIENCEGIRIENCRLQHVTPLMNYECHGSVIRIASSKKITIFNSELAGCGAIGVTAWNGKDISIKNCFIHHNTWTAIYFHDVEGISVESCVIEENCCFIQMYEVDNILMKNNIIRRNGEQPTDDGETPGLEE